MSEVQFYETHRPSLNQIVTVTEAAKQYLLSCLKKEANGSVGICVSVKETGCFGFSYVVDYIKKTPIENPKIALDEGYELCLDKASLPHLMGIKIDYVKKGFSKKLIFENPNQTGECGCGESFTIKK